MESCLVIKGFFSFLLNQVLSYHATCSKAEVDKFKVRKQMVSYSCIKLNFTWLSDPLSLAPIELVLPTGC